jgi:hypothetical protein
MTKNVQIAVSSLHAAINCQKARIDVYNKNRIRVIYEMGPKLLR